MLQWYVTLLTQNGYINARKGVNEILLVINGTVAFTTWWDTCISFKALGGVNKYSLRLTKKFSLLIFIKCSHFCFLLFFSTFFILKMFFFPQSRERSWLGLSSFGGLCYLCRHLCWLLGGQTWRPHVLCLLELKDPRVVSNTISSSSSSCSELKNKRLSCFFHFILDF